MSHNQQIEQQILDIISRSKALEELGEDYRELIEMLTESDETELPEELADKITENAEELEKHSGQFQNDVELLMKQISMIDQTLHVN